jgi:hypothetical protein
MDAAPLGRHALTAGSENRMKRRMHNTVLMMGVFWMMVWSAPVSLTQTAAPRDRAALTLSFGGVDYLHRWSKNGQNEFTPRGDENLATWGDMITINVYETVRTGEDLAELANKILATYQGHGKILKTDSKPRTADHPAEHLIAAALGNPTYLEAAFARCLLVNGVGMVVVVSHRIYAREAGPAMSDWLKANGSRVETTLMAWDKMPSLAALRQLPQSK